jgi:hypothetical protein
MTSQREYLDRIDSVCPTPPSTDDLWNEVHDEVQQQLACLETEVRRKLATVRVAAGRTTGSSFFLFSYRTFSLPDSGLDPVVAGLTFTPDGEGVRVEADVSGEQTGDLLASWPSKTVAASRAELLAAVSEAARLICQAADAVVVALGEKTRRVD